LLTPAICVFVAPLLVNLYKFPEEAIHNSPAIPKTGLGIPVPVYVFTALNVAPPFALEYNVPPEVA
jgi:hypothetical protein